MSQGNQDTPTTPETPEAPRYPAFVEQNGSTYYYIKDTAIAFGLWQIDGKYYYFSTSDGAMRTGEYNVKSYTSNGMLSKHRTFHFDETYGYAVDANGNALTTLN